MDLLVSTHKNNNGLAPSRLVVFRLKLALQRRDEAIQRAHERYAAEVAALGVRSERASTLALVRGEKANGFQWPWRARPDAPAPALAQPFGVAKFDPIDVARDVLIPAGLRRFWSRRRG